MGAIFITNKPKKYVFIQLPFHLAKGNGIRLPHVTETRSERPQLGELAMYRFKPYSNQLCCPVLAPNLSNSLCLCMQAVDATYASHNGNFSWRVIR